MRGSFTWQIGIGQEKLLRDIVLAIFSFWIFRSLAELVMGLLMRAATGLWQLQLSSGEPIGNSCRAGLTVA